MSRRGTVILIVVLVAAFVVGFLAGCGPEGQPCPSAGSVKAQDGKVYTCTQTDHGLVWK